MSDAQHQQADDDVMLAQYHDAKRAAQRRLVRRLVTRPVVKSVVRTQVFGAENVAQLPKTYAVVGNHTSHLDAPAMFALLPDTVVEMLASGAAADYFYRVGFISRLTQLFFNTYPVERAGKRKLKRRGSKVHAGMTGRLLRSGVPVLLFPEGTRSRDGQLGTFNPGLAGILAPLGAPLVPVALVGCGDAMPIGRYWPKFGRPRIEMHIGQPVWPVDGETPEQMMNRAKASIEQMLTEAGAL